MRRTLVLAATLLLLFTVVTQCNHILTSFRIHLFVGGLYVAYAALTQRLRYGVMASVLGGLLCDANAPAEMFGTHALLFAAAHVSVFHVRDRIPRDETATRVIVALLTNLALFLVLSFSQIHLAPAPATAWTRLFMDLVVSQLFLALIAPWFIALQTRSLLLTGAERPTLAEQTRSPFPR